jgi:adenosylcobyric acid synthase
MPHVRESYQRLAAENDVIVIEGAGSPVEINLKQHDIVNMRVAEMANAACLLVGDIDRGGVFASLLGTVELLEPEERARIRGFVVNKFRGDVSLLMPGIRMMEDRIERACLGVVPYLEHLALDEEDSLGLPVADASDDARWCDSGEHRPLRVAVIVFPSLSNFTDFDALRLEPSVVVRFCRKPEHLREADVIILPGSKQTADDLLWMRAIGLDKAVIERAKAGLIAGICGGMQMLGRVISDPNEIERSGPMEGLSLLSVETTMQASKVTVAGAGQLITGALFCQPVEDIPLHGYEIHVGETSYLGPAQPFARITRKSVGHTETVVDGCISPDSRIFGTYLHGIFDGDAFRHTFIQAARAFYKLAPAAELNNWESKRQQSLDCLADAVSQSLDMPTIFEWVGLRFQNQSMSETSGVSL